MTSSEESTNARLPGTVGVPVRGRPSGAARSAFEKSERTHERLRRAAERLLEATPLADLRVSHITAAAKVSHSAFYIYFANVHEVVLASLAEVHAAAPDFPGLIADFRRETLGEDVKRYVAAYLGYWDAHHAVLRTRNLAADGGDLRFREVRDAFVYPIADALEAKICGIRGATIGVRHVPARAMAAILNVALERLASASRVPDTGRDRIHDRLVDAAVETWREIILGPNASEPSS